MWTTDCARASGVASAARAAIAWSNLLLCCDGNEHAGRDYTCDKRKHDTDICADFVNPQRWSGGALVTVERDGRVKARPGLPVGADHVITTVLNLNSPEIIRARRSVLAARRELIDRVRTKNHGLSPRQRVDIAERLRKDAASSEYGAVLLSLAAAITR